MSSAPSPEASALGVQATSLGGSRAALDAPSAREAPASEAPSRAEAGSPAEPLRLSWPVDATTTSKFGQRDGRQHSGVDLGAPEGTPSRAAAGGRVKSASYSGGYGNLVVVEHADGTETRYAHMSKLDVRAGERVSGDTLGAVGSTGHSTGPHLHFEVRRGGEACDPLDFLPPRR